MTIKEMEELTGMSRTNIRFYETEGLVNPQRRENGYREYSKDDVKILMKVKLLRSMDVPLDQVKAAALGSRSLGSILDDLDKTIAHRQAHQERTRQALRLMRQYETEFDDLNPDDFLALLETGELVNDAPPRLNLPWRRYWARCLDFSFYNTLVSLLLIDFQHRIIFIPILTLIAMLVLEPLLLSMFGTTLGKAIFGIRITDREGRKLRYSAAIERTWTVMWEGEALRIPLICLYFQYKSLDLAEQEIPLSWENESELTFKDDQNWRYGLYLAAVLAQIVLIIIAIWILGG